MEAQQGFATDPYNLERLYPTTEEGAEQLIEEVIATTRSPSSPHPSSSSLGSDVLSIHEDEEALVDLLSAEEIPLELGLVFLPPEIQCLYQEHQVTHQPTKYDLHWVLMEEKGATDTAHPHPIRDVVLDKGRST